MVAVSPYFVLAYSFQVIGHFAEHLQYPALRAFVYPLYSFDQFFGSEFLEIARDAWQRILPGADDHVQVARHQAPCVYDQSFFFLAMAK